MIGTPRLGNAVHEQPVEPAADRPEWRFVASPERQLCELAIKGRNLEVGAHHRKEPGSRGRPPGERHNGHLIAPHRLTDLQAHGLAQHRETSHGPDSKAKCVALGHGRRGERREPLPIAGQDAIAHPLGGDWDIGKVVEKHHIHGHRMT